MGIPTDRPYAPAAVALSNPWYSALRTVLRSWACCHSSHEHWGYAFWRASLGKGDRKRLGDSGICLSPAATSLSTNIPPYARCWTCSSCLFCKCCQIISVCWETSKRNHSSLWELKWIQQALLKICITNTLGTKINKTVLNFKRVLSEETYTHMFNRFPSSSGSLDVAGPQSIPKVTFTGLTYRVMTHSFIFIPLTISQTPDSYIPLSTKSTWISDWRFKPNLTNAYVFITSPSKTYPPPPHHLFPYQ